MVVVEREEVMMFRWLGGAEEAPYKTILINWAKATGKAVGYPVSAADLDPNYWSCRDKAALAQFALLWPGLGKPALTTDGTCITGGPVAELTDAIKKALQQWQTGGTPINPCPPGSQLDPTGKLCVPVPVTNIVMDFFKAAAAAATPVVSPSPTQTVNFGEQTEPPQKGEDKAAPPKADDIIATCPPGQVLLNSKCVPIPQQLPPEKPAAPVEAKTTPWGWIVLGLAGAAGLVWSLTRGAGEIGSALRANPRTLADVKNANRAAGMHWFDRDTTRFFRTRIESKLLAGDYFITSEAYSDTAPRLYSIRQAQPDGGIETIGRFQGYTTKAAAQEAVKKLQSRG